MAHVRIPKMHTSHPAGIRRTAMAWSSLSSTSGCAGRYVWFCRCAHFQNRCCSAGTPISSATSRRSSLKGALRGSLNVLACITQ